MTFDATNVFHSEAGQGFVVVVVVVVFMTKFDLHTYTSVVEPLVDLCITFDRTNVLHSGLRALFTKFDLHIYFSSRIIVFLHH